MTSPGLGYIVDPQGLGHFPILTPRKYVLNIWPCRFTQGYPLVAFVCASIHQVAAEIGRYRSPQIITSIVPYVYFRGVSMGSTLPPVNTCTDHMMCFFLPSLLSPMLPSFQVMKVNALLCFNYSLNLTSGLSCEPFNNILYIHIPVFLYTWGIFGKVFLRTWRLSSYLIYFIHCQSISHLRLDWCVTNNKKTLEILPPIDVIL